MKIIIAQFAHIESRVLNRYLAECKKQKIDLVVLGEYVANRFFKEYKNKSILKREFESQVKYFSTLADKFDITIVVPLIEYEDDSKRNAKGTKGDSKDFKIYKSIAIFEPHKVQFYRSTRLMGFLHWNEKAFFDNDLKLKEPLIFNVGDLKVSAIFGWEAHFDEIFAKIRKKGVDVLCVPCANTFGSNARWQRLLQTRSFLNSCFIIRVNRVGIFLEDSISWDFYGESFVALPDGNLGDMLGEKEGILVSEINKDELQEMKELWQFR